MTKNATPNAGSVSTFIVLPFVLTAVFVFFQSLQKFRLCAFFERIFMKRETIFALWIRVFLQLFMTVSLVALQMAVKAPAYPEFPSELFSDSHLSGDLCSEIFKYYGFVICMIGFLGLTLTVAWKHRTYAAVYKAERMSIYASELIYAYKATKQEILAKEQQRLEMHRGTKTWWTRQELAIRDTIVQSIDKSKMDAILYLNRQTGADD